MTAYHALKCWVGTCLFLYPCLVLPMRCSLHCERILWSAKSTAAQLTVVTHATVDRLPMVREQCASYRGPLAVAVYKPLLQQAQGGLSADNQQALARTVEAVEKYFEM